MSSHFCLLVIGFCINLAILPKLQLKKLTQRGVKCSVNLAFEKHSTQSVLNFLSFTASKISLFTKTKKKHADKQRVVWQFAIAFCNILKNHSNTQKVTNFFERLLWAGDRKQDKFTFQNQMIENSFNNWANQCKNVLFKAFTLYYALYSNVNITKPK